VHRSPWPAEGELPPGVLHGDPAGPGGGVLAVAAEVLGAVRRAKTDAKRSMRASVERLTVVDDPARLAVLAEAEGDLREAGGIVELVTRPGEPEVVVELSDTDAGGPTRS
jgi:valyl-tRNA synthetase